MLLLRAHVLALGHSGVREQVIDRMVEMLNRDVIPAVPEQGSLGASGDLAPLASLALPLIGHGRLLSPEDDVSAVPAGDVLAHEGLPPLELEAKEGLALVNGTQGMLSIGVLALARAEVLARTADVVAAMTIEAALGTDAPFDDRLQVLRPHPGQAASAGCAERRDTPSAEAPRPRTSERGAADHPCRDGRRRHRGTVVAPVRLASGRGCGPERGRPALAMTAPMWRGRAVVAAAGEVRWPGRRPRRR